MRVALRLAAIPSCSVVTSRRIDELLQWHLFRPSVRYGSVATVTYGLQWPRLRRGGGDSTATCTATAKLQACSLGLQAAVSPRRAMGGRRSTGAVRTRAVKLCRASKRECPTTGKQAELAACKTLAKVRLG